MPSPETAVVYPGTCFFEGTNISEGRGTTKPFEQFGAPFIDGSQLAKTLNGLNLPGVGFRPVFFQPTTGKYADEICQGVQVHVLNRTVFDPLCTGLEALATVRRLYPEAFSWRIPQGGIHNFDRLAGTDLIRNALDRDLPVAELLSSWADELQSFAEIRHRYLAYA
jgi:uncharacterized protein YbbC (DUF1343 family)